jgi:uncharacterized protein (TIGR00106 family)
MALMEISVVPLGTGSTSLSSWIAQVVMEVKKSGLDYSLHDMGTTISGDVQQLLALAARLHEVPFEKGASRVYTVIKIDDRRDKSRPLGHKTSSVLEKMKG